MTPFHADSSRSPAPANSNVKVVSISGGKGGVGKTFFSVNFATELQQRGFKVLLFDGDIDLSNVNLMLHIDESNCFRDFLDGKTGVENLVRKGVGGVDVIFVGDDMEDIINLTEKDLATITASLAELEQKYDYILIDTQAGLSKSNRHLIANSDSVIMIANQEITALVDLYKTIKLYALSKPGLPFHVVMNKMPNPEKAVKVFQGLHDTLKANNVPASVQLLGYILDDPQRALSSIQKRTPVRLLDEGGSLAGCFRLVTDSFLRVEKPAGRRKSIFLNLFSRSDS